MFSRIFLILLVSLTFACSASAKDVVPAAGWATVEDWDKAVAYAKKTNKPITILYSFESSSCPKVAGCAGRIMRDKSLEATVRVIAFTEDDFALMNSLRSMARGGSGMIPEVYMVDPNLQLVGFVDYGEERGTGLKDAAERAVEIVKFKGKTEKEIAKADKDAAAGKFKAALKAIDKLAEMDSKIAVYVASKSRTGASRMESPKAEEGEEADVSTEESQGNKSSASLKEEQAPTTPGLYYGDLRGTKRSEYNKLVEAKLAQAREHVSAGEHAKARALLNVIVNDNADLPAVQESAEFMKELAAAKG